MSIPSELLGSASWRDAFIAVTLISVFPNLILFLVPESALTGLYHGLNIQHLLLCFASGGLLGDVFMHALPHLLLSDSKIFNIEDAHVRAMIIGSIILFGFFMFFLVEKVLSVGESKIDESKVSKGGKKGDKRGHVHSNHRHGLAAAGVLNIVADLMHNFTDGMAIGATYSTGGSLALATTISIFFHEIPHELGDFAILLESGFTKFEAIKMQMVTALAAVLGTLVGLCASSFSPFKEILLAITIGGFLFVSTIGILPMISSKKNLNYTQITLECLCFLLGVALMVMVAFVEELDEGNRHHAEHTHNDLHDHYRRDGHRYHHDEH